MKTMRLGALFGGVKTSDDESMASSSSSASTPASVPGIPMVDDSKFLHGRVDPGLDESVALVESVPGKERETTGSLHGSIDAPSNKEPAAGDTPQSVAESSEGALTNLCYLEDPASGLVHPSVSTTLYILRSITTDHVSQKPKPQRASSSLCLPS